MPVFVARSRIAAEPAALAAWHARPGALARLTPPWERVDVLEPPRALAGGERAVLRARVGPFARAWVAEHRAIPEGFVDEQVKGPFRRFVHEHRFLPDGDGGAWMEDRIEYDLPGGWLGEILAGPSVRRRLRRMFPHRHAVTARDVPAMAAHGASRTIAITGATGLVGRALASRLEARGDRVVRLVRGPPVGPDERRWDPRAESLDPATFADVDAVVHLAGETISRRWTARRREEILVSRRHGTRLVAQALARAAPRPRVLVCASAVGFYGDAGEAEVDEDSPRGGGFLADVVEEWEAATRPAAQAGLRVVNARFGIVLSPAAGALQRLLLPFRLGAGGPIGRGRQWWSWVDLDDAVGALVHSLDDDRVRGPLVVASPAPVRNGEFARTLGRVLGRPSVAPLPGFAAKLALGRMAQELLLFGCRARPRKLIETGFVFEHPDLEEALRHELGRPRDESPVSSAGRAS